MAVRIRKPFRSKVRVFVPEADPNADPKLAVKQEFREECDINEIMARMKRGINPPAWVTSATPYFGDFANLPESLSEAFERVAKAKASFESLPLEFRRELDHDPRRLDSAPRELFERFGLTRKAPDARSGSAASTAAPTGGSSQGGASPPAVSPQGDPAAFGGKS